MRDGEIVLRPATDSGNEEEEEEESRPTDRMGPLEGMGDLGTNKRREIAPIKYAPPLSRCAGDRATLTALYEAMHSDDTNSRFLSVFRELDAAAEELVERAHGGRQSCCCATESLNLFTFQTGLQ